jgi:hypothetical protein
MISRNEKEAYRTVCITVFIPMAFSLSYLLVKIQNVVNMCDGLFSIVITVLRAKEHFLSKPPVTWEVSQFLSEDCAMMDIAHSLVSLSLGVNSSVDIEQVGERLLNLYVN